MAKILQRNVCCRVKSGHDLAVMECPLLAKSGYIKTKLMREAGGNLRANPCCRDKADWKNSGRVVVFKKESGRV